MLLPFSTFLEFPRDVGGNKKLGHFLCLHLAIRSCLYVHPFPTMSDIQVLCWIIILQFAVFDF